jgi:error-prone DNA polymerase
VQGRGSAANSAVCYSLGITAVDPMSMELLFERFLSEERGEWPDIDLDLPSGDEREKVIQHVYRCYGERGAAMTANVITYRNRMAARDG